MTQDTAAVGAADLGAEGFYRVRDAHGREYIANTVDQLPEALRSKAERVELPPHPEPSVLSGLDASTLRPGAVHWPSFALGASTMVVLVVGFSLVRKAGAPAIRLALFGLVCVLIAGLYLGMLRRMSGQAGTQGSWLASPTTIVDDARRTVHQANEAAQERDKMLRELEQEGKRAPSVGHSR